MRLQQDALYLRPASKGANCTRLPDASPSLATLRPESVFQNILSCLNSKL